MDNDIKDEVSAIVDKLASDFKTKLGKSLEKWEKKMMKAAAKPASKPTTKTVKTKSDSRKKKTVDTDSESD